MTDTIEQFGQSTIQHGPHSNRAYLMSLSAEDLPRLVPYLDQLAQEQDYTKVFAKVPEAALESFRQHGYEAEAAIPEFYRGEDPVYFMGKYFCPDRQQEQKPELVESALEAARSRQGNQADITLPPAMTCRLAEPADALAMAEVYRQVFATYPFPIHDPDYLRDTMESHVDYLGIWDGDHLVALASAEKDVRGLNAEMTDFATLPDYRGQGLAGHLLDRLEEVAGDRGIQTAYTIARAYSHGMNITFARGGYTYSGTLTHNTQISGELESMNVWYKPLQS
ncbi:putative beta-lysine N-acetyltransferase [Desulfuromonas sp. AOP6]|uniref:putative beta-lysine N-acetyltransferase n=1 Tax=Desulfuromonas sp. AOP6 TaxID=1566351 RepID=UPI00127BB3FD|nr:putative beta-lysine N-acetyltransferase [Desulfuromonas sp. AOP6]BCA78906.1 putative beta-lysine N-acetyltransferase [Desulfuromonas sp. AOP6]